MYFNAHYYNQTLPNSYVPDPAEIHAEGLSFNLYGKGTPKVGREEDTTLSTSRASEICSTPGLKQILLQR